MCLVMLRCDRMFPPKSWTGLLMLGTLPLAACSNQLSNADVEAAIKADIERQGRRLSLKEVRCPSDVEKQAEAYFRCVGELDPEGTFTINVTQTDSQGNVTWEVPNSKVLLNLASVEARIQQGLAQALGRRAPIDCGSELYRINQPGDQFECQIVGGLTLDAKTLDSILVKIDAEGNLNWQERSALAQNAVATTRPASSITPPATSAATPTPTATPVSNRNATETGEPVKTTTVKGPSGREIKRSYMAGDDD
jgi:hypothetical protein